MSTDHLILIPTNFITQFTNLVQNVKKGKSTGLVVGLDHNFDFLKSSTHAPTHQFLEEIVDLGLPPSTTQPTRITHSTATLIDNILIEQRFSENYKSAVLIENLSDHLPCLTTLCGVTSPQNRDKKVTCCDTGKKNLDNLHRRL